MGGAPRTRPEEASIATENKPTAKQLAYLRALCDASGETTTWPRTRREASRAIERPKGRPRSDPEECYRDRRAVKDAMAGGGFER